MRTIATRRLPGGVLATSTLLVLAVLSGCGSTLNGQSPSPDPARLGRQSDGRRISEPVPPTGSDSDVQQPGEARHGRRWHVGLEYSAGPGGDEDAPEAEVRGQFNEIAATADWQILRSVDLVGKWGFGRREGLSLLGEAQRDSADFSPTSFAAGLRWMARPLRFLPRSMRVHITGLAVRRERALRYQWQYFSDAAWGAEFAIGLGNWIRGNEPGWERFYAEWGYRFIQFDDFRADVNGKTAQLILPANGNPITLDESSWLIRLGVLF